LTAINVKVLYRIPLPFSEIGATTVLSSSPVPDDIKTTYTVHLDTGNTVEVLYEDLFDPIESKHAVSSDLSDAFAGLPAFLSNGSKVTLDHNGTYHKGFLHYSPEGGFQFQVKRNLRSSKIDFVIPLPDFKQTWSQLIGDNVLLPGHSTVSTFLRPNSSNNQPSANFVSAKNLLSPCPPSLLKALHPSNPDRDVWLESYNEEKKGLEQLNVYEKINKKTYLQLKRSGRIGKALPSMCVLVIKPDKDGKPHRAKSRIVVLGNHEDRYFSKSQRYAPVLK
jgi:hypothetical protein